MTAASLAELAAAGVDTVIGTVVNPAGLIQAKAVPLPRISVFADPGLGASPSWHGFAADQTGIAFSDHAGVVGDQRIRIDPGSLRIIGAGLAWAPAAFFSQHGAPVPGCSRGALARIEAALADAGRTALVGHEVEFVLVNPDGGPLPSTMWAPYGLAGVLEHETFLRDVLVAASAAGIGIEGCHGEYGVNQFEISLAPRAPVAAADQLVLTRIIIGRVARRHGLRVSLSPAPFVDGAGCGAHQHFSLTAAGKPVFAGGSGAAGMTADGEHALAGVLDGLREAQGVLCGSIVSGLRLRPGNWAGAHPGWGTENREVALRFVRDEPAGRPGGHVEVKVVDATANPYFASAAILGLALAGIDAQRTLAAEITGDPAGLPAAQRSAPLTTDHGDVIAALDDSRRLRDILGDPAVDMVVAVRRLEQQRYRELTGEQLTEKFRMAWSV